MPTYICTLEVRGLLYTCIRLAYNHILFAGSFSGVYHHFAMLVNKLHLLFFTEITDEFALRLDVHGFLRYVDIISIHSIASWNVIHIYQCYIFVKLYRLS